MKHLWEVDHDYYGPSGSYWASPMDESGYNNKYDSWAEYVAAEGMYSALTGLNFLYRWDWEDYRKERAEYGDEDYEHDFVLELFWLMPRKGILAKDTIVVTPEDEPVVREWLNGHWVYMREMWYPLWERKEE